MLHKYVPDLTGVPETMLFALYNRASEARGPHRLLRDPESCRIYDAIQYDFKDHFGNPDGAHAVRSLETDRVIRQWLQAHPDGMVVSLGEGLETQRHRVDNGRVRWLTVDLPEAIRFRENFLAPTERFRHFSASALDRAWMDEVDASRGVFIVAQGLFMYFEPDDVRRLMTDIVERFPSSEILFDTTPRWLPPWSSRFSLRGWLRNTKHYRIPSLPWAIDRHEIAPTLKAWHPRIATVRLIRFRIPHGLLHVLEASFRVLPILRNKRLAIVHVVLK